MTEETRKLASVQRIREILPIPGADMIELVVVNAWKVVAAKSVGHQVGDLVVYCEIDSYLPIEPEFEFLRKSSYKKMGNQEGFRLKTIKLRGQVSQGLIIPLKDAYDVFRRLTPNMEMTWFEGLDVSEMINVQKYEQPIPAELAGTVKGGFPSFLRKTDEERIQNFADQYPNWVMSSAHKFYASEKLDGSSATYYYKDGQFGVCSRNLELAEPEEFVPGNIMCDDGIERPKKENTFWKVAKELKLKEKLEKAYILFGNLCLQGELIGEGIQGNPYNIKGHTVKFYNAFDIDKQERLDVDTFMKVITILELETVPIMTPWLLPTTIDEMLKQAEGKSILNYNTEREGLVIRSYDMSISFKAISNKFLLENE
jgi:RNA ligase (TIGR02306 family)